jgi:Tfp pilus assembly protein PilE
MKKSSVRAFTILEVTITMLIVGLLIALTYTSYSIIIKSYHAFKDKNDRMMILVSLDHVLARDFERADRITKDADGITMNGNAQVIKYTFSPDFITRTTNKIDTFKVQAQDVNAAFENMTVNEVLETEEQNRIDELTFTAVFQDEKIPYQYHKQYSSDNLIKRNPNAVN